MSNGKRLIDVDVAEKSIRTSASLLRANIGCGYDEGAADALSSVADMLKTMPTVDAVEVVHGRWRWGRNSMNQYGAWCSECECGWEDKGNDFDRVQGLVIAHKYCPNCGAKMDGDGNG